MQHADVCVNIQMYEEAQSELPADESVALKPSQCHDRYVIAGLVVCYGAQAPSTLGMQVTRLSAERTFAVVPLPIAEAMS